MVITCFCSVFYFQSNFSSEQNWTLPKQSLNKTQRLDTPIKCCLPLHQIQVIQKEAAEQRTSSEQSFAEREEEDTNRESGDEENEEGELALWSTEVHVLELEKGERGLGFSILDYQVCLSMYVFLENKHTGLTWKQMQMLKGEF